MKKILLEYLYRGDETIIVYADGTFTGGSWEPGKFSEWTLIDGVFAYKHPKYSNYTKSWSDPDMELSRALMKVLDSIFEEDVLEHDPKTTN